MRAPDVLIQGMLGLGDNLHQRAVVRHLMASNADVWLETPWPSVYGDLVERGLRLAPVKTILRTQKANGEREASKYHRPTMLPQGLPRHRVWYTHDEIRKHGGFLAAMCAASGLPGKGDFSFQVPPEWTARAHDWLCKRHGTSRPLMLYRPLVNRSEWNGCRQRNPDGAAYVALAQSVRERFFVVSVADLLPSKEWLDAETIKADVECHRGELPFEMLAGLARLAGQSGGVVFCSPGFALVLAQAVGAPLVAVFGGHEAGRLYSHGSPRDLMIEPRRPCECFSKTHDCDKRIDLPRAIAALDAFCDRQAAQGLAACA